MGFSNRTGDLGVANAQPAVLQQLQLIMQVKRLCLAHRLVCIRCHCCPALCTAGVTVEVKARQVRVKGPRGVLSRDFKHLSVDMYLIEEDGQKKLKVRHGGTPAAAVGYLLGYSE
jgi:hypothetical protein